MLDIKWIRENQQKFVEFLKKRNIESNIERIIALDEQKRELIHLMQEHQQSRNKKSKYLGTIRDKLSVEFISIKQEVNVINEQLKELEEQLKGCDGLQSILDNIPNLLDDEVHYGVDDDMNKLIRSWGEIRSIESPLQHFEIGENLGMMDFVQTAKISGSRFVTLKSSLAKLERALINFMIDIHTSEFDFVELSPPLLVKATSMYNTAQFPKLIEDSFITTTGYSLIPTGEVPLTNMVADTILAREILPLRYVAYTPCFRSEAGSAGRDVRGMIRMHQFGKVELVTITTPDESSQEHEYMTNAAETILKKLNLPYRVMLLCSGSTGFAAKKTYDIEVWLPGQNQYREISSCSNCGDFQARRMKARYKEFGALDNSFVHTLNGSGLPIGRTMIAILENYQNTDGSVTIPDILVKYMGGIDRIEPMR